MKFTYIIKKEEENLSINEILKSKLFFSTRLLHKLLDLQKIYLNNNKINTKDTAKANDILSIDFSYQEDNSNIIPTNMNLDIIYEDDWILAVNKAPNTAVHPSSKHFDNSLSNGIKYYFNSIDLKKKIRPINRLDFDTSGIVLFAKCEYIQECLSKQMGLNLFKKEYLCFANGIFENKKGTIDLPIARNPASIIERCVHESGQKSITHYEVLEEFKINNYSLVKCILETGRTHQIRVHFKTIGHPLLNDTLYSTPSNLISRQALHSSLVSFIHPITNKKISITSSLPNDMNVLKTDKY